mmetsp:Transcript_81573/g.144507  ORF Transcript_81573/g.144507 Transcript_81573/m.144507 type:complete len:126 (-) Transcript_81573:1096-1473(-)
MLWQRQRPDDRASCRIQASGSSFSSFADWATLLLQRVSSVLLIIRAAFIARQTAHSLALPPNPCHVHAKRASKILGALRFRIALQKMVRLVWHIWTQMQTKQERRHQLIDADDADDDDADVKLCS